MNRLTLKAVAAAFAIFWHGISPAPAQQVCMPTPMILQSASEYGLDQQVKLEGAQVAAAVKWFNSQPPESNDQFDEVYVLRGERGFGIVLGRNGLTCTYGSLPAEEAKSLDAALAGAAGNGS